MNDGSDAGRNPAQTDAPKIPTFSTYDSGFAAYENGKHRRYELLFAVNGGAFAVAKIFPDISKPDPDKVKIFLGGLTVSHLAIGMIAFTLIMLVDITAFGLGMRRWAHQIKPLDDSWSVWGGVFSVIGMAVLFVLSVLICGAWYLVQDKFELGSTGMCLALGILLGVCVACYSIVEKRLRRSQHPAPPHLASLTER